MKPGSYTLAIISLVILFLVWLCTPFILGIEWMKIAPIILLICCFIIGYFHPKTDRWFMFYALTVYMAGFTLAAFATNTGKLFGQFFYGHNLGALVWDTPLVVGIYWLLLCYCASVLVYRLSEKTAWLRSTVIKVLLASLVILIIDILIEPVAADIDFWYWKNQQVPLQNYTAWFVFAAAFNFLFHRLGIDASNKIAPWFITLFMVFLLVLNLSPVYLFATPR